MKRFCCASILGAACIFAVSWSAYGQTSLGTMVGNVLDATGAAIPQVSVTVKNQGTSATRAVITNQDGAYTIPSLPVGMYTETSSWT
jgi:hypothetical protein